MSTVGDGDMFPGSCGMLAERIVLPIWEDRLRPRNPCLKSETWGTHCCSFVRPVPPAGSFPSDNVAFCQNDVISPCGEFTKARRGGIIGFREAGIVGEVHAFPKHRIPSLITTS
jgi:hypothetical protein